MSEFNEAGVISEEMARSAQVEIFRLEGLVQAKKFSPERIWRDFLEKTAKELGSMALAIKLLEVLGYASEKIMGILKLSGYSNPEIVEILSDAQWSDGRIGGAALLYKESDEYDRTLSSVDDVNLLDFLLSSGLSDDRIIRALIETDSFTVSMVAKLSARKWTEYQLFKAAVDADCFGRLVYGILTSLKDKDEKPFWIDAKLMEFMDQADMSDVDRIKVFKDVGKMLSQTYQILVEAKWTADRIIAALIELGYTPGDVVSAFLDYTKNYVGSLDKRLRLQIRLSQNTEDKQSLYDQLDGLRGVIQSSKARVVSMLTKLTVDDRSVYSQLSQQDWPNADVVEYLVAAEWSPERIMRAMIDAGWSEFFVTKMINESAADYEFKGNDYWTAETVANWKTLLRQITAE